MRPSPVLSSALLALPVALLTTSLLAPGTAAAQSAGSAGSVGDPGSSGSSGSSGSTGSTGSSAPDPMGSVGGSGPCRNFLGNFAPTSLGVNLTTGSLADTVNSVAGVAASSVRDYPRWIAGPQGTIPVLEGATSVLQLVTGPTSPARTDSVYNIHGTDLGIMFTDGPDTMVVLGDTYGHCTPTGNDWRSNVMLVSRGGAPTEGLRITGARPFTDGQAGVLIQGAHQPNGVGEVTVIPTAAISIDETMYMRVMSVRDWNAPGGWNTNYSALARSTDGGHSWVILADSMRRVTDFRDWDRSVRFEPADAALPPVDRDRWYGMQMSAFLEDDGYLYEYLTPSGRRGPATIARVPLDRVEDPSAYRWFAGDGNWSSTPSGSREILPAPVEELSVSYNRHLDRFVALTSTAAGVVSMRVADHPEGPWSAPQVLVDRRMFPNGYAPMIHPASAATDDGYLYYTLSTWDAYNVFLLRTDLDAFDFTAPGPDPRTVVRSRVDVGTAVEAGAIDDDGVVDPRRLEEVAEVAPAEIEPIVEPAGR